MKKIIICILIFVHMSALYAQNHVIVSKKELKVIVLSSESDTLCYYDCAMGLNLGDKQYEGDKRTPEGKFFISSIEDSELWEHNFNDGNGTRPNAYGPYFIRLSIPNWSGIGIHGTCFPESVGTRCSSGCIRLNNDDISDLIKYVNVGTEVIIEKDI